jgi:uncharacterized radical SAM protein YgiQ
MDIPCTRAEMLALGWDEPDVVLVSGDALIDTPHSGTAVIARVLIGAGFRVGVIAQPDIRSPDDIRRLGAPRLFWGVTAGCVDSMVANTTASGRRRRQDDFTPGGENTRRPDRASIAYSNLIRSTFRPCAPVVLGGVEASLRRIVHYDFWSDRLRRPILFDAKADILVYGMAERTICELATALRDGAEWRSIRGLCYAAPAPPGDAVHLPAFAALTDPAAPGAAKRLFLEMFRLFADNQDPVTARTLAQPVDLRWLVHNPPAAPLETGELDRVYALPFTQNVHPRDAARGAVRALDTVRFSLTSHRGCYGGCAFCAIAMHQGRRVTWRSRESLVDEATGYTRHPAFTGIIHDVGGPTANMYGFDCACKKRTGACAGKDCLFPSVCPSLPVTHEPQIRLLQALRDIPGVRQAFVGSGIRPDLVLADTRHGGAYLDALAAHHVSGQLKLAPEHSEPAVLRLMRKPGIEGLLAFRGRFEACSRAHGRKQFLTYYFIAAHPGCTEEDMRRLRDFAHTRLRLTPEQVQIFTPTPSTWSTAMWWTGLDPDTGEPVFVERRPRERQAQKDILTGAAG